jgi:hypothetical protein
MNDTQLLHRAGWVFVAGFAVHNIDHMRRGLDVVTDDVVWGGTAVGIIAAITLTMVFTNHRLAPTMAAAAGIAIAFGVSATHLMPHWSALSDPLPGGDVDAFTWFAVLAEVAAALVLGLAGLTVCMRRNFSTAASN